jgi:putative Holliday junction resolvase
MDERVLALDVGDARIGIAVSDAARCIAQPLSVYRRVGYGPDVQHILGLCQAYDTRLVVCGLPRNMDGSEGPQAQKTRALGERLAKAGLRVYYQDERLTTATALQALAAGGAGRDKRRSAEDKVAAAVILRQWLDSFGAPGEDAQRGDTTHRNEGGIMEDVSNIIELVDEEGQAVEFEHLMTVEHEGGYYIVLMAAQEDEENEEGEVVILKMEQDDKGEDCYVTIDDDDVLQAVFDTFVAAIEEEEDAPPLEEDEED